MDWALVDLVIDLFLSILSSLDLLGSIPHNHPPGIHNCFWNLVIIWLFRLFYRFLAIQNIANILPFRLRLFFSTPNGTKLQFRRVPEVFGSMQGTRTIAKKRLREHQILLIFKLKSIPFWKGEMSKKL